jgi:hypothetical protein
MLHEAECSFDSCRLLDPPVTLPAIVITSRLDVLNRFVLSRLRYRNFTVRLPQIYDFPNCSVNLYVMFVAD